MVCYQLRETKNDLTILSSLMILLLIINYIKIYILQIKLFYDNISMVIQIPKVR